MNVVELIVTKRDGGQLEPSQIHALIESYTAGDVPDYQMSAFLMASFLNGMSDEEADSLTDAMLATGDRIDLGSVPGIKVDKHSTGGVGDKVSLILAPLVASCGVPVPMISGHGLGHTGGTLDKLESIPGFSTDVDKRTYRKQLESIGIVMIGQTEDIAPADRKLYALRDVTGTVDFNPFIAASIMSKKLAEGCDALVLDVKCGSGAFTGDESSARALAERLVGIGERFGKKTVAWMTDMSSPLGHAIGNWPEMAESIACLRGEEIPDLMEVTLMLAAEMLVLGGKADTIESATEMSQRAISSGDAFEMLVKLVEAQGGDTSVLDHPDLRTESGVVRVVTAPDESGPYVDAINALEIGRSCVDLGAGRSHKEATVDSLAGIYLLKKESDSIVPGEPLFEVRSTNENRIERIITQVRSAFSYTETPFSVTSRLKNRYAESAWMHPVDNPSV
ncbi:MAG: thymidine phosphorylase [Rhodothermia bacterium]|nr:MAG: thymidine phosphorylase [Rhodothermia bacterium]